MSITVAASLSVKVTELLDTTANPFAASTVRDKENIIQALFTAALTATSTVPATKVVAFKQALTAGAATIDLTSLAGTQGTVVGSGLKVQIAVFENPATNANPITITGGAANGYLIFGTSGSLILNPGDRVVFLFNDDLPDVDGTHKTIDLAGTLVQVLNVLLVLG